MTDSKRDNNGVPAMLGTSNSDGATPIPARAHPTTHRLDVADGAGGSDLSSPDARRDANQVAVVMGVSSADGLTPTAIYADAATGALLIKSS